MPAISTTPYGNVISATGSMAVSPLRYRGYVYNHETGLYYLQSRYYDPEMGRFLNADVYVSTGQGFIGNNMFAYCYNNIVNAVDMTGEDAIWLQDSDNVGSMGHSGLLLEDAEGNWWHFYWAPDRGGKKERVEQMGNPNNIMGALILNL